MGLVGTTFMRAGRLAVVAFLSAISPLLTRPSVAQDVEPRFVRNAPEGSHVLAIAYSFSDGAVLLNKTLPVENLDGRIHSWAALWAGFFDFWGMSGRLDAAAQFATGTWRGLLAGADTTTTRTGLGDPLLRVALFFVGAPALSTAEFRNYDAGTVVGAAFRVRVPLGQYSGERLLNLGTNRWSFSPRVGVSQSFGRRWNLEAYTSAWFFTANTNFFGGVTQTQKPTVSVQLHVEYALPSGMWVALSGRQAWGGATSVDGVSPDNAQDNLRVGVTLNMPITRRDFVRFALTTGLTTSAGNDYTSLYATYAHGWAPRADPPN